MYFKRLSNIKRHIVLQIIGTVSYKGGVALNDSLMKEEYLSTIEEGGDAWRKKLFHS